MAVAIVLLSLADDVYVASDIAAKRANTIITSQPSDHKTSERESFVILFSINFIISIQHIRISISINWWIIYTRCRSVCRWMAPWEPKWTDDDMSVDDVQRLRRRMVELLSQFMASSRWTNDGDNDQDHNQWLRLTLVVQSSNGSSSISSSNTEAIKQARQTPVQGTFGVRFGGDSETNPIWISWA